jgi:hypothetical protein
VKLTEKKKDYPAGISEDNPFFKSTRAALFMSLDRMLLLIISAEDKGLNPYCSFENKKDSVNSAYFFF